MNTSSSFEFWDESDTSRLPQITSQTLVFTLDRASSMIGIPESTLAQWARTGELPAVKAGKHWLTSWPWILAWLETKRAIRHDSAGIIHDQVPPLSIVEQPARQRTSSKKNLKSPAKLIYPEVRLRG